MMYHIPGVLNADEVAQFRAQLDQAPWSMAAPPWATRAHRLKNNQQVDTQSPLYASLQRRCCRR
ncbi:Fe(II)-dependent oxygenase superfamily protein [Leclercia adecarboxylata]|uniref:Fe(II)-dependent oxygenase superfamily protein n=1 Tax=Leclercia adecarboxylata TaxID=83655 RepID=A0A4U9HPW6_9ENTR|nr:Fe(II)-dependent oxygenase superfamily protein [Leclercia adecarboxylata]